MMDLIPGMVDGAVVFNLHNGCRDKTSSCEHCLQLVLNTHNWIKQAGIEYAVFDLMDEKDICPTFLEELLLLRKRLRFPFLFSGVMKKPREFLEGYNHGDFYPMFVTPEDAVRALRIQHPGVTETPVKIPVKFGQPLLLAWREGLGEALGLL